MSDTEHVPQQHLVSAVLIKRWAVNGRVLSIDLDYPDARPKHRAPAAIGYKVDFIKIASKRWEERWQKAETLAPQTFDAIDDRSIFKHPNLVDVLKDLIAIHFGRSHVVDLAWQLALGSEALDRRQEEIARILRQDGALDALFHHHTGLVSPGTREARRLGFERFIADFEARVGEGGASFAEAVGEAADQMRARLERQSLDIGVADEGSEFILSDSPVQPLDHSTRTAGVLAGVSLDKADTIVMPLGPGTVVAPGRLETFTKMSRRAVMSTNSAMVVTAQRFVYVRPGSEQDVWVRQHARRFRGHETA